MRRITIRPALLICAAFAAGRLHAQAPSAPNGAAANRPGAATAATDFGSAAELVDTDFLGKAAKREPLSSDPGKRLEQIKQQKEQLTKQKEQKKAPFKLKPHKEHNDVAKNHIDKYLKAQLSERYPEQSFPRDYKELYSSNVVELPNKPNLYTMRVDYIVTLKNNTSGKPDAVSHRCFMLDGNLKVVGSMPAVSQEREVREFLGLTESSDRPTRAQIKKEAAALKELKRKPAKPVDPNKPSS
jgi:hypothetical protein